MTQSTIDTAIGLQSHQAPQQPSLPPDDAVGAVSEALRKETLKAFHDEIFEGYAAQMPGETPTLFKMKDLWTYLIACFASADKHLKKIRKASNYTDYKIAVNHLSGRANLCPPVLNLL